MEHLLLPRGTTLSPFDRIPYVAVPYDNGPFLGYPQRSPFKHIYETFVTDDLAADFAGPDTFEISTGDTRKELDSFLQTWLFFGTIHEIFGELSSPEDFILQDSDGSRFLNTAGLDAVARTWVMNRQSRPQNHEPTIEHLTRCIGRVQLFLDLVLRKVELPYAILTSIAALAEAIEGAVRSAGPLNLPRTEGSSWGKFYRFPKVVEQMIANGWCPADASQWNATQGTLQTLFYLEKLRQPNVRDHSGCSKASAASANTIVQTGMGPGALCNATQYDIYGHFLQHRCPRGNCGSLKIDDQALHSILDGGYIALLDVRCSDNLEKLGVKVVSSEMYQKYAAISHVWADGMGNPFENALPRCQVAYAAQATQQLASTTDTPLKLWLDTLCCPAKSMEHKKICLSRMAQIYRDATYVLVLDASLGFFRADELDTVELLTRLAYSSWSRRLWTYQEAAISRSLWLQLKDKAVSLDQAEEELYRIYQSDAIHVIMVGRILEQMQRMRSVNPERKHQLIKTNERLHPNVEYSKILELVHGLRWRSMSVATDEALILSTCMLLDGGKVAMAAPEHRMQAFWQSMDEAGRGIPQGVIFAASKKLPFAGFQWAPCSLMQSQSTLSSSIRSQQSAKLCPYGLIVTYPGCHIRLPRTLSPDVQSQWDALTTLSMESWRSLLYLRQAPGQWIQIFFSLLDLDSAVDDIMRRNNYEMDIILDERFNDFSGLEQNQAKYSARSPSNRICFAVTCNITQSEDKIIYFREDATAGVLDCSQHEASTNLILETALRLSQDAGLRDLLSTLRKNPCEDAARSDYDFGEFMTDAALQYLDQLTRSALEDAALRQSFGRAPESEMILRISSYVLFVMYPGRYGEITQTWPASQKWCVD